MTTFKTVGDNLADLGLLKRRNLISLILAALVYLGLYQIVGWTLDTGRAVVTTAAANAALAVSVSVWLPPKDSLLAAISEFIGMLGASVVLLFVIGPGNLFPIVIVFLGGLFAISTGVGWGLGRLMYLGFTQLKKWSGPSVPRTV